MGVMTTSSQNFMEIDMPGWWLSGSSVDLDFRNSRYYDSSNILVGLSNLLSISRASIGYAKTGGGVLTQFPTGTMRITDLGLLIEDARTNLIIQSQTFSSASWNKAASTVTANSTIAPDGTLTGSTLVENTTGSSNVAVYQGATVSSGVNYAWSVWAKANVRTCLVLAIEPSNNNFATAVFDLQNGVVGETKVGSGSGTIVSTSIEPYANGWYRCSMVAATGVANGNFNVAVTSQATGNTFNTFGDVLYTAATGTSALFLWGAQQEQAAFASSYIPTTTTSATRAQDLVTFTGSLDTVTGAATASMVLDTKAIPSSANLEIVTKNSAGGPFLLRSGSNTTVAIYNGSVSLSRDLSSGGIDFSQRSVKCGVSWSPAGRSITGGGLSVATDAVVQAALGGQDFSVGLNGSAAFYWGTHGRLTAWNSRLADATLQALTQ